MDGKTVLVIGAGGLALLALLARQRAGEGGESAGPFGVGGGDSGGSGWLDGGAGASSEPPGGPFGASEGSGGFAPSSFRATDNGGAMFQPSPALERELAAIVRQDARDASAARRRDTAIQASIGTAIAVPAVAGGAVALSRALAARAATPAGRLASIRTSPGLVPRAVALARTVATSTAGTVSAGVGLGLAGTAVLEHTGTFDRLGAAVRKVQAPKPVVTLAKSVALPTSVVGGVAKAIVGKDTVAGNVKAAFQGTVQQKGYLGAKRLVKRLF